MINDLNLNPEIQNNEKADQLAETLIANEIEGIVLDLDDTVLDTTPPFNAATELFRQQVCITHGIPLQDFEQKFYDINLEAQHVRFVNPNRWEFVVERLHEEYKGQYSFLEQLQILMDIYKVLPTVLDGATEHLEMFQYAGMKLGLVTHAPELWTGYKIKGNGLDKYFAPEHIVVADMNRHKGSQDWAEGLVRLGLKGRHAIGIGDNKIGDIVAADAAGFGALVHVPAVWAYYNQGVLPERTMISPTGIGGVADVLIAQLSRAMQVWR